MFNGSCIDYWAGSADEISHLIDRRICGSYMLHIVDEALRKFLREWAVITTLYSHTVFLCIFVLE